MKSKRIAELWLSALAVFAFAGVLAAQGGRAVGNRTDDITVDDPRPLASAIQELEARHGWAITYEDPPYEFVADTRDVTQAVRKDGDPSKGKVLIPNGRAFTFTYPPGDPARGPDGDQVLPALLNAYHASGNPGRFRMLRTGSLRHVVPSSSNDARGIQKARASLLDAPITIDDADRTGYETLRAIVQAVSQANGTSVVVGTIPVNLMIQARIREQAANEPARAVLMRALAATKRNLSWQLFCQPGTSMCALNVHIVNEPTS